MLSVQIRELAYEIWSREINEICCALLQLGLSQLIWRTQLIPTAQQYQGAGEVQDMSLCVIPHTLATGLLLWMKMCLKYDDRRVHMNFKMSRMLWFWLMLEYYVAASWFTYQIKTFTSYIWSHIGMCSRFKTRLQMTEDVFQAFTLLEFSSCSSWCRVRTASCPIFTAITSEAQLLALFQEALKAGRTFGRAPFSPVGYLGA